MRYLIRLGLRPIGTVDAVEVSDSLRKHADEWDFEITQIDDYHISLQAETVWDLGSAEDGNDPRLDYNSSHEICRRLYKAVRRVASTKPIGICAVLSLNEGHDEGWLHQFFPL